jgi:2-methylcitrate dehydratase PrpD
MTGPEEFLSGIYGYFHLFGKDRDNSEAILEGLGKKYKMVDTVFKKYPSCGATQSSTDAILALIKEHDLTPESVSSIYVYVTPYAYRLTGKDFQIGDNPRVDAQFNIQYCVANALLRRSSRLEHFDERAISDLRNSGITRKIRVFGDTALNATGHTAMRMEVKTVNSKIFSKNVDVASGFPGNPLTQKEHLDRFRLCLEYAGDYYRLENLEKIISTVGNLEDMKDVRAILPLLRASTM